MSILLFLALHFKVRSWLAKRLIRKWEAKDPAIAKAIGHNTRWYRPMIRVWGKGWIRRTGEKLENVIEYSRAAIRKLNDQFVSPAGSKTEEV